MTAVQLTACPAHGFFLRFSPTTQCPYCDQEQKAQQISSMMRMGVPSTHARATSLDAIRGVLGVQASQALRKHGCLAVNLGDAARV